MRKRKKLSLKAPPRLFYLKMTAPYVVNALRKLLDTIDGELKRGNYPRNVRLFESPFKHRSARQSVEVDKMFLNCVIGFRLSLTLYIIYPCTRVNIIKASFHRRPLSKSQFY